jgi:glycosyltransferase involved in cell wall biosynthesis
MAVSRRTISVVVPACNEARNLEAAVSTVIEAARNFDDLEVLIVNDGSTDDTGEVADRLAAADRRVRVVHHESNQGFAAAYGSGLARARMRYVTFAPGDNEIAGTSLTEIFDAVGKADLVVPYHGTPWKRAIYRRILTWTCVTQINVLFGWHLPYFQGPTVYPTELARALPRTTRGFFFITEMLVYALAAGYTSVEVPLIHQERVYGRSKAVALSNIVDAERTILRLWWQIRLLGRRAPAPIVQDELLQRV